MKGHNPMRKCSRPRRSPVSGVTFLNSWGPPIVWMAAIAWFSTDTFSADHTGAVLEPLLRWLLPAIRPAQIAAAHYLVRKGAHVTVYAILAALVLRALGARVGHIWSFRRAAGALAIVAPNNPSSSATSKKYHRFPISRRSSMMLLYFAPVAHTK
jgi:hypothetical protein